MNLDATDLVRAIEADKHTRRQVAPQRPDRPRTRRKVANGLRRLATRLDS